MQEVETSQNAQRELPHYISCKPVWALQIESITRTDGGWRLIFTNADYAPRIVSNDWIEKRGAKAGGYLVQYADGYLSWTPNDVFEAGNTPRGQWGVPREQENKYGVNLQGRLFNRHSGQLIPDTEPVFVLRAKDRRALDTLLHYFEQVPEPDNATRASLADVIQRFTAFRREYPHVMKDGDSKAPAPPVPHSINQQTWAPGERGE